MDTKFKFPDVNEKRNKSLFNIIIKFVQLLSKLFESPEDKRKEIYISNLEQIKDKDLIIVINEVLKYERNIDMNSHEIKKLNNLINLYDIEYRILKKYEDNTLNSLIDKAIIHIGFNTKNDVIIKFISFMLIKNVYLKNKEIKEIEFVHCQIDQSNEVCFNLLLDLFRHNYAENIELILSYVILRFNTFKELLKSYDMIKVSKAAENSKNRIESDYSRNDFISIEKISMIFIEEYEKLSLDQNDNEPNKFADNESENKIEENAIIIDNDNIRGKDSTKINKEIKEPNTNVKQELMAETLLDLNSDNQKENNKMLLENNIKKIKDLLSKLNMENNSSSELIRLYKELFIKIDKLEEELKETKKHSKEFEEELKETKKHSEKFEEELKETKKHSKEFEEELKEAKKQLEDKADKSKEDISELANEVNQLKEDINKLNKQNKKIKEMLSKIQCRELAKSFLFCHNLYLTKEDFEKINSYKYRECDFYQKKSEIIVNRLRKRFSGYKNDKKLEIVINLVIKACLCLSKGNTNAHSFVMDVYNKDMDEIADAVNDLRSDNYDAFRSVSSEDVSAYLSNSFTEVELDSLRVYNDAHISEFPFEKNNLTVTSVIRDNSTIIYIDEKFQFLEDDIILFTGLRHDINKFFEDIEF
jgi:hypothetical protein